MAGQTLETPAEIIDKLNKEINADGTGPAVFQGYDSRGSFINQGLVPAAGITALCMPKRSRERRTKPDALASSTKALA